LFFPPNVLEQWRHAGGAILALVALALVFAVLFQGPAVFAFALLFPVKADGATSAILALRASSPMLAEAAAATLLAPVASSSMWAGHFDG